VPTASRRCHQYLRRVRPWARAIKQRTGIDRTPADAAVAYGKEHRHPAVQGRSIVERGRAREGREAADSAPRGNPADMPPAKSYDDAKWHIGTPDLIVKTTDVTVKAGAPDWWGEIPRVQIGLTEDRYVTALEVKEVNNVDNKGGTGRQTVGGHYVFHHMIWSTRVIGTAEDEANRDPNTFETDGSTGWPVHEVGRNADFFDMRAARLLKANSSVVSDSVHLHSNGRDTTAHLEIGFKFAPKGFSPEFKRASYSLGNGVDIDIRPMEANQTPRNAC
jgi:hypothetical protein